MDAATTKTTPKPEATASTVHQIVHTPGPWSYQEDSDAYTHIVRGPTGQHVVQFRQDMSGVSEANARLTAAAPIAIHLLKRIIDDLPSNRDWLDPSIEREARSLIHSLNVV